MPGPVLVPNWCREAGRGEWKDGGRMVINTDRRESVLVSGITTGTDWHDHDSVVGSGQKDTEEPRVERLTVTAGIKQRKSCKFREQECGVWSASTTVQ